MLGLQDLPEIYEPTPGNDSVKELYVQVVQKQILYTDGQIIEALVIYFHTASGYPLIDTWLKAIKASN